MSETPLYITELIDALEKELRDMETTAGQMRDTIASIRGIWRVSPLESSAVTQSASAPPPPIASAPTTPKPATTPKADNRESPAPAKRHRGGDREGQVAHVLQVAATLPQPFSCAQLHDKVSDIPIETVSGYLSALVAAGDLTRTGQRRGTRYTVSSGQTRTLEQAPSDTYPVALSKSIGQAVMRVLATGASYDTRELLKGLRGVAPELTAEQLEPIVLGLVESRHVLRIATDSGPRFRKRAA